MADSEELYLSPQHPYTEALMSSVPRPEPGRVKERIIMEGDVADPSNPPSGCYFHPRCRYAEERCEKEEPLFREIKPDHWSACHFAEELELRGVLDLEREVEA
jgi:peptide/nickel transport system ATP-binding protein